jgi:signal peptidase
MGVSDIGAPARLPYRMRAMISAVTNAITKAITKAITISFIGLAGLGAAVLLVAAVTSRFSASDDYSLFGHPALIVLSGSMTPTIDTGDFVVDNPASGATNLRAGQIITFYDSPGSHTVITHRIVQVVHRSGGVFYRTKGDANDGPDPMLRPARDVIGVYAFRILRGGYFLVNLSRPALLGLLLAAPLLWVLAGLLRSWAAGEDETRLGVRS